MLVQQHLVIHRAVVVDLLSHSGRQADIVAYQAGTSLLGYLPDALQPTVHTECLAVLWNGRQVSIEEAGSIVPCPQDYIGFAVVPTKGKSSAYIIGGLQILIGVVLLLTGFGAAAGIPLIVGGVATIGQALLAPTIPLGGFSGGKSIEGSPTFSVDGFRHTYLPGVPIPVLLGKHRFAGQVTKQFIRVGTDGETSLFTEVSVSHGPIYAIGGITADVDGLQGTEIPETFLINGTGARNFKKVRVSIRLGNWNQAPFPELNEQITSLSDGTEVVFGPSNAHTLTTSRPVTAFEVNLHFSGGLYQVTSTGNKIHYACKYTVRWREAGTETWEGEQLVTFDGPHPAAISTKFRKDAPLGYDTSSAPVAKILEVQVERITLDDSASINKVSTFVWNTLNEISPGFLSDPGIAKVLYQTVATGQLQNQVPTFTQVIDGILVHSWDEVSETSPTFNFGYTDGYVTKEDVEKTVTSWKDLNVTGAPVTNSMAAFSWVGGGPSGGTRELRGMRVKFRKSKSVAFGGTLKLELRPDSAGQPHASTILATSTLFDTEQLLTTAKIVDFAFPSPPALTTGTRYWLVIVPSYTATSTGTGVIQMAVIASATGDFAGYSGSWTNDTSALVAASLWHKGQCPGKDPAWQSFEVSTNKYWGSGKYVRATDWDLAALADWTIENNKCYTSQAGVLPIPRWQVGWPLDSRFKVWDFLQKMGSLSRTRILKVGRKIRPVVIKPRAMTQVFSQAWMVRGSFEWTSEPDIHEPTMVEVQFKNENANYGDDIAPADDPDAVANGKRRHTNRVQMYGLTSPDRAKRAAKFILDSAKIHDMNEFAVPPFGINCLPGDTVGVQHYLLNLQTHGSRVIASTATTVQIDAVVADTIYSIVCVTRGTGADVIQQRSVTLQLPVVLPSGITVHELTISAAWNVGDLPQAGDTYALTTEGVSASVVQQYTIHDWRITEDLDVHMLLSKYDETEEIFNDTPQTVPESTDELLSALKEPAEVESLQLTEELTASCDGGVHCAIRASWHNPEKWNKVEVWIRPNGTESGGWDFVGESWSSSLLITCEYFSSPGNLEVAVRTVTTVGARQSIDDAPRESIAVKGPWMRPPDVVTFTAVALDDRTVILAWTNITAAGAALDSFGGVQHVGSIAGYEIRRGPWWSSAEIVTDQTSGPEFTTRVPAEGSFTFWIVAKTRAGVRSENPLSVTVTVSDPYAEAATADVTHAAPNGASFTGTLTNLALDASGQHLEMSDATATYEMAAINLTTAARRPHFVFVDVKTAPLDRELCSEMQFPASGEIARRRACTGWALDPVDADAVPASAAPFTAQKSYWTKHRSAGGTIISIERRTSFTIEYAISTDAVSYGSWTKLTQGMCLDFAAIKFRILLVGDITSIGNSIMHRLALASVRTRLIRKKIIEAGARTLASGGQAISFPTPFPSGITPNIVCQINGGAAGEIIKVTSPSNTGFTGQVLNAAGAGVSKQIWWHATW